MFNHPRRPVYNYRTDDMPQESANRDVNMIDSNRFWKLFKDLRRRQEEVRSKRENKKASTS